MRKLLLHFKSGESLAVPSDNYGPWPHRVTHTRPVLAESEAPLRGPWVSTETFKFDIDRARFNPDSNEQHYVEVEQ